MYAPGVAARMFKALSEAKTLNLQMIATPQKSKISCVVHNEEEAAGQRALKKGGPCRFRAVGHQGSGGSGLFITGAIAPWRSGLWLRS